MRRRSEGFTVIELVVVVAMALILLGIAALNASTFLAHYRLREAARQVMNDLRLVRTKAIAQSERYRVVFPAGGGSYTVDHWDRLTEGWEPHALPSKTVTLTGAAAVELPAPVRIASAQTVVFQPRGNAAAEQTISLQDPGLAGVALNVDVSFAGQVSID